MITLDNRARAYDPANASSPFYPNLRPMNRVWLRMRFNGVTRDIFKGYVESYEQQLPEYGLDAVTIVKAVDEFKPLAPGNLPNTDPPRDTYADVVAFDNPAGYWQMSSDTVTFVEQATVGPEFTDFQRTGVTSIADGAIVGGNPDPQYQALSLGTARTCQPPDGRRRSHRNELGGVASRSRRSAGCRSAGSPAWISPPPAASAANG